MAGEILDVFHQDPFTAIALTDAVQRNPFQPVGLGALNVFEPNPIRTKALAVEERTGKLVLIPFSERGAEGTQRTTEKRDMRYFNVPRLMHDDTVYAEEVQGIREFGTESVLMQIETEVARRLSGPTGLLASVEYTKEFLRLAALQGLVLDPKDGSVKYNWFNEFGITQAPVTPFDLSAQTPNSLRPICNGIVRTMARKAQGAFTATTRVYGMCGDAFYDAFVNHVDVIRTFVNWSDARALRDNSQGAAFDSFDFAGITWFNYRGSDDNATIKVPDNDVLFFPVGAPGIFREATAPGETVDWVNTPGKPVYVLPIFDVLRRMWWKMETYAYPLFICTRPEVLLSGTALASAAAAAEAREKARKARDEVDAEAAKEAASNRSGSSAHTGSKGKS
ncbi:major capsid protein [Paraburkholderia sp. 35.1]|uniref:major capsid protein n=1 Tax=Paraburkholderia sp. 35.1 TaxID=2991058 RepID=UPI003D25C907